VIIRRLRPSLVIGDKPRAGLISDETFIRGLAVGALIGAAIAGSTLWSRIRRAKEPPTAP
jgi:hypothetical protein